MESGIKTIDSLISQISDEARKLKNSAIALHFYYKMLTVTTIILGVSAPALVTYSGRESEGWKIFAVVITALATASATIRSVLRHSERYSNSELTSLNLSRLKSQIEYRKIEIQTTVRDELVDQKFFSLYQWASDQHYEIKKVYVDKEIAAVKQESVTFTQAPKIELSEMKI